MREFHDASGRLTIDLGEDGPLFLLYAARLENIVTAKIIRQLDGLEQRYWDFDLNGATVVLHTDIFAGISLQFEDGSRDDLLRQIAAQITQASD